MIWCECFLYYSVTIAISDIKDLILIAYATSFCKSVDLFEVKRFLFLDTFLLAFFLFFKRCLYIGVWRGILSLRGSFNTWETNDRITQDHWCLLLLMEGNAIILYRPTANIFLQRKLLTLRYSLKIRFLKFIFLGNI